MNYLTRGQAGLVVFAAFWTFVAWNSDHFLVAMAVLVALLGLAYLLRRTVVELLERVVRVEDHSDRSQRILYMIGLVGVFVFVTMQYFR